MTDPTQVSSLERNAALEDENRRLRQAVERLGQQALQWRATEDLLEQSAAGFCETDTEGRVTRANARYCQLLGRSADDLLGRTMQSLTHPQDWPHNEALIQRLFAHGEAFEIEKRYLRADGSYIWVSSTVTLIVPSEPTQRPRVLVVAIDISGRKRTELALRESEARFAALVQTSSVSLWSISPDWRDVREVKRVLAGHFAPQENVGPYWIDTRVPPEDRELVRAAVREGVRRGEAFEFEHRLLVDGAVRWQSSRAVPLHDEHGVLTGWFGAASDITGRKALEDALQRANRSLAERVERGDEALRQSEERERLALSAFNGLGLWDWDAATNTMYADATLAAAFGLDPARTAAGLPLDDYIRCLHPDDRQRTAEALRRALATGQGDSSLEYRLSQPDGTVRWIVAKAHIKMGADARPTRLLGIMIDITAQHLLEEQLRQSQKMEAVGQLTGGLAHDFNNMLTGISGSLELLQLRIGTGQLDATQLLRYIGMAQGAAKRAAALTHRLLAFSRRQTLDPKPTGVNRLVAGMEDLLRRTVGPAIEIEVAAAPDLWPILVDPHQLENALLNLCLNARDAMPDGGRLHIETFNVRLDEPDLPPGDYVCVSVADNGLGMTPEVSKRAFDPFFTTKPLGEGTGLGLSMVYGFARQSGGQARIVSRCAEGTTVRLYLPRHAGSEGEALNGASDNVDAAQSQGETILVVDDEPTVLELVTEVLAAQGYRTLTAADGAAALEILGSAVRLDLLITDVGLPGGMNGRQVADAARVHRPDLKVLFITGYAENAVIGNARLDAGMEVLTKPFALDALVARIQSLLGGRCLERQGTPSAGSRPHATDM